MVHSIAREIPTCVGRARDVYEALGHAPYVRPVSTQTEPTVIFQTESLSDPGASAEDRGALEYRCKFTTSADGPFEIVYSEKMYAGGVEVVVEGEGAEVEEGEGVVKVTCTVAGKVATVVLRPR